MAQRIHRENAERMLLASFVAGLSGVPGCQVRYSAPQNMEHELSLAVSVQEAENKKSLMRVFIHGSKIQSG